MKRRFHTSNKDDEQRSRARRPADDLYFRRHNLQSPNEQESAEREYSRFANHSVEDVPKSFRSFLEGQKETKNYSKSTEDKHLATESRPKSSSTASDFLLKLPTEVFLKIVLMKLDIMEINGFAELSELAKFINMSQTVFSKSLPAEVKMVLKQTMSNETEMNLPKSPPPQPKIPQVSELTRRKEKTDSTFISEILNLGKRESLSASSTVTSHQYASSTTVPCHQYASSSTSPYQNRQYYQGVSYGQVDFPHTSIHAPSSNVNYAYNAASSNITPVAPTLTVQEPIESYMYQSQYPSPSLPDHNNFRY